MAPPRTPLSRPRRSARAERGLTLREQRLLALITIWEQAYAGGNRPEEREEAPRIVPLGLPFAGRLPQTPPRA